MRRTQKIDKSSGLIDGRMVVIEVREVGGVAEVEVEKVGRARRAKLNYLRTRKGKEATAVRE